MVRPLPSITRSSAAKALFVGNVAYADRVYRVIPWALRVTDPAILAETVRRYQPDLIVVAGWRHLIPPDVLALAPTVGFHSARLPEYPGRAPVPWTLLRGDREAVNTFFYLDDGVDSGDIIDSRVYRIGRDDTPSTIYDWIGASSAEMLAKHLPGLLAGTAPRAPQDPSKRGPLTTPDGWRLLEAKYGRKLDIDTRR